LTTVAKPRLAMREETENIFHWWQIWSKERYSVEITYGINSVISKLMTFAENAETGQFLFLIMLILSYFTCS
jgi:hypothetical protein